MSLASGLAVAVLAPLMIAMAPVVAIACIATERKRRRALLRRREFGGTSADPL